MTRDQYAESVRPLCHSGAKAAPPGQSKSDRWLSWTPENVQSPDAGETACATNTSRNHKHQKVRRSPNWMMRGVLVVLLICPKEPLVTAIVGPAKRG
jgi:hypothetical protein